MDALRQFREYSTWRKHDIVIDPHEVYALNFTDSMPNIFVVNNPNTATLKIGISSIPRVDSYEFKVEYNTTETFGRPFGSAVIYILNDSSVPVKITLFSIEKDFDPALLKNMNVSLAGYTLESSSTIDGVKEGVVLPVQIDANTFDYLIKLFNKSTDNNTQLMLVKETLDDLKEVVNDIKNNMSSNDTDNAEYLMFKGNNFSYTATEDCTFTFDWLTLLNEITGNTSCVYLDTVGNILLSSEPFYTIRDFSVDLKAGDTINTGGDIGSSSVFRYYITKA